MNTNSSTLSKRSLGCTDIKVTPIGLGGNKFSGGKGVFGIMMPDLSQEQVNGIIKTALDGGINWFDTAEIYGFGHSEQGIANALKAAGRNLRFRALRAGNCQRIKSSRDPGQWSYRGYQVEPDPQERWKHIQDD
jgi:predicted aldo/keto reductase-like oxidoreductase